MTTMVEDVPTGNRFEFALCRCRSVSVPARQVYAGDLGTRCQLPGHLLADPGVGARYQGGLALQVIHAMLSSSEMG